MPVPPLLIALALLQATPAEEAFEAAAEAQAQAQADAAQPNAQVSLQPATPIVPVPVPVPVPLPVPVPVQPEQASVYPPQAYAAQSAGDRRIQLLTYDPDQIVTLPVTPGFASVIELGEDERVENLIVGNSAGWQVTANRRGDRIIVKPLGGAGPSNLIVLTGSRRYVFVLDPFGESSFIMRFRYPQQAQGISAAMASGGVPQGYRFRGSKMLFPLAMSDDGRRTTIRWAEHSVVPAIVAVNGREERLVNGRMVGNDFVIEGAASRYRFRYGKAEATAIRQTSKRRR